MKFPGVLLFLLIQTISFSQENADTLLTVREILIEGNETTKDFVVLREMKLKPGEKITAEALEHDQGRIYSLQLFNKVELEVKPEGTEAVVIVHVSERWYFSPIPFSAFGIAISTNSITAPAWSTRISAGGTKNSSFRSHSDTTAGFPLLIVIPNLPMMMTCSYRSRSAIQNFKA